MLNIRDTLMDAKKVLRLAREQYVRKLGLYLEIYERVKKQFRPHFEIGQRAIYRIHSELRYDLPKRWLQLVIVEYVNCEIEYNP